MGGRAVDCDGLENRCGGNSTGGSNPSPSASILAYMPIQTKSPRFCGIFHALTLVWAKYGAFSAQIYVILYNAHFGRVNGISKRPDIVRASDFGIGYLASIECCFLFAEVAISFCEFEQGLQIYMRGYFTI